MKQLTTMIAACTLLFAACSKDKTTTPATPSNNNPGSVKTNEEKALGTWVWVSSTSDKDYDWKGTGKSKDALKDCYKDNTMLLNSNGFADVNEGTDLCWLAPKTFQCSWSIYDSVFNYNATYYKFVSITDDTLRFSEVAFPTTDKITINHVWGKKK